MTEFQTFRRTGVIEARPYEPGETLPTCVSISVADRDAGSPKAGDMIARNARNHDDQWLIAQEFFQEHYEHVARD